MWYEIRVCSYILAGIAALCAVAGLFQSFLFGEAAEFAFLAAVLYAVSRLTQQASHPRRPNGR